MSNLEIAGVLISFFSLALLISNYKKLRERILKISLPTVDPIIKGDLPIGAKIRCENLSDYYTPDVEITINGSIGDLQIFKAVRTISFDPHDSLDATVDLSKRLEERCLLSIDEIRAKGLRISVECSYYQIIIWNRLRLFKKNILRKYIYDIDNQIWRHPYDKEWM